MEIKRVGENEWEIPKSGKMNVPGKIFANEKILDGIKKDKTLKQVKNVACLPGILKASMAMPDAHQGYGFPIGGVAAFDLDKGIISPGGVGFDINCGVRLMTTDISIKKFMEKRKDILHDIKRTIPAGVGRGGKRYPKETINEVMIKGSEWALEKGFATKEDLKHTEENGKMKGANPKDVSKKAITRGLNQLGTLGAGNHFIDVQVVEEIYDKQVAKVFGLKKGMICIMIHCGSRGLGHQIASDYIKLIKEKYGSKKFPDEELGYAKLKSELGQKYFSAMKCAVNFAFCNRQMIMHEIRRLLKRYYPNLKTNLVYDLAHNISKIENHLVEGTKKDVLIIRKGATRSFGSGRKEIPVVYRKIGQPVLIPGSMSTPSFVLVGTKQAEKKSFGSSAHGAGRAHSRAWAHKTLTIEQLKKILSEKDIILEGSFKATIEESEFSYKDVEEVIDVSVNAGLGKKVAKLKPLAVVTG